MHGGQAIPAFDFYMAPYVRSSYIEEVQYIEQITGEDYSDLYHAEIKDYITTELTGMTGKERAFHHAINRTVGRVHQAMEAFVHNMNTIHSRGGNSRNTEDNLRRCWKWFDGNLPDSDLEEETWCQLLA